MRKLDRVVRAVAGKDIVVTLTGESGTGKEVLARRVHDLSQRRCGPFVPINCAAMTDQRVTVTWQDVGVAIKASAERRLGRSLLRVYLGLALFGLGVVVASLAVMHL